MSGKSKIEWTQKTWNCVRGCRRKSAGCERCYAERQAIRIPDYHEQNIIRSTSRGPRWTGEVSLAPGHILDAPLRWTKPSLVFVNSMADLFYKRPFEDIAAVFGIMAAAPRHTFQVLTKYSARMVEFFAWLEDEAKALEAGSGLTPEHGALASVCAIYAERLVGEGRCQAAFEARWPLPNVWLGVSVEHQEAADERIPHLLSVPAAVRWLSMEPLLGPVELTPYLRGVCGRCGSTGYAHWCEMEMSCQDCPDDPSDPLGTYDDWPISLDWIVVGGESGPGARPMNPSWARSLLAQCQSSGSKPVPFFFKQWGSHNERGERVGKKVAGRLLDGVEWSMYPDREGGVS